VVTIESNGELSFLIHKNLQLAGVSGKVESLIGDALKIIPSRKGKVGHDLYRCKQARVYRLFQPRD
jgi:predicted O-methyltransferase YrrM